MRYLARVEIGEFLAVEGLDNKEKMDNSHDFDGLDLVL